MSWPELVSLRLSQSSLDLTYLALCARLKCLGNAELVPHLSLIRVVLVQKLHTAECFLFPAFVSVNSLWSLKPNLITDELLDILITSKPRAKS